MAIDGSYHRLRTLNRTVPKRSGLVGGIYIPAPYFFTALDRD
ncbi:hypothetical protein BDA96_02G361400 [Sorghum bicolor]|uniref:Uncharacterized protein n=1 Tax=Sorghum bicolor TaxID=4558 RepID=A0A921RT59_SORBI|nr:hypothetical protein BDA96_02G361400 [Sorghum bicolor]